METETLGLLSGIGHLPVDVAKSAKERGCRIVAIGVVPDIDPELPEVADVYYDIHIGKIGKIISTLKKNNVKIVTMIGKVTKEILYKKGAIIPDMRALKILSSVPDRKDDTIMNAIVKELESEEIFVMDQTYLIKPLMPGPGVLTKRQPTPEELADMDFGYKMAKEIGRLDIGQTVVVKNMAVMAVEAIEGTDACILRGGKLGKDAVVAKTAKPAQDDRFDVPGVGTKTVQSMIESGCKALVIEAGHTLLTEREKVVALADEHGITIVAK